MNLKILFYLFGLILFLSPYIFGQNAEYSVAKEYQKKGDLEAALESYSESLSKNLDYRAYMGRASVYIELKLYTKAISDFNKAIDLNPEDSRIYYNRGNCFLEMGEEQAAYADFMKSIELDPANYHAYNSRGFLYSMKDSLIKAEEDYLRAISLNLNYRIAYVNLCDIYIKQDKIEIAIELMSEFVRYSKNDVVAYNTLANLYHLKGNVELASKFYVNSLRFEKNQPEIIEKLTSILVLEMKENELAIELLTEMESIGFSGKTFYLWGLSFLSKFNYEKALEKFEKAKKEKDSLPENLILLESSCYGELGEIEQAFSILDSLERAEFRLHEVYLQKSVLHLKKDEFKKSLYYIDKAIDLKESFELQLQKAYLLRRVKKYKLAKNLYQELDTTKSYRDLLLNSKIDFFIETDQKDSSCACMYEKVIRGDYEKSSAYGSTCKDHLDQNKLKVLMILSLMQTYESKGLSYKDLDDFNFLIEIEPNSYDFSLWRGVYLKSQKEFEKSILDFSRCIELNPNRFEGYFFASNAMLENKDTTAFLTTITMGVFKTRSIELLYSRALFYKRIQDLEYAYNDLKEILVIDPNYSNALYQLGLIFIMEEEGSKACKYLRQAFLLGNSKARLEYKISCQ